MDIVGDLSMMFDDFGVDAVIDAVPVRGIFDASYAQAMGIAGSDPVLVCRSADVSSVPRGADVAIGTDDFAVIGIEPDGQGITLLRLESA